MKEYLKAPSHIKEDIYKHLKEGIFVKRNISFWRGIPKLEMGNHSQKLGFSPSIKKLKHDGETARIKFNIRVLFFHYAIKTKYGFFIPKQNIDIFWKKCEEIRSDHKKLLEYVLSDYENICNEIRRRNEELAKFKWMNELRYPGEPPESFLNAYNEKRKSIYSKDKINLRFKFDIFSICPLLDENNSSYGPKENIIKNNEEVANNLYKGIITSRCTFIRNLNTIREKLCNSKRAFVSLVKLCHNYKNNVFYGDQVLLDKMADLRLKAMTSLNRKTEDVIFRINDVIECIIKNENFLVGLIYKEQPTNNFYKEGYAKHTDDKEEI